ncbi:N-glycosylase/DNA lyase-like [Artemia franciscana]|uniref:N-glycosylase/DNA lyase n=1 Tax=Artemia franciscana TaxID=6661 RepID=A0AA88HU24_ARTSF|nr:hypothetical protein QYM36_006736 [Artemia franciscana]
MWVKGRIPCSSAELNIDIVLQCGQSFRWKRDLINKSWQGVFSNKLWILKQGSSEISYEVLSSDAECHQTKVEKEQICNEELVDYFQFNVPLVPLYDAWSQADEKFKKLALRYQGVRMLRQDPVENVFSFICSSNNNIQRISSMVEHLCSSYGKQIAVYNGQKVYSFPELSSLMDESVERNLRTLGFGYRAKYIQKAAEIIEQRGGRSWLVNLRNVPYVEAKASLVSIPGIGEKVADCICLMSLDKTCAIPVDTHVFQIAKTYLPALAEKKSVTHRIYSEISIFFQELYGPYAGWAHTVLFSADLRHLKDPPEKAPKRGKNQQNNTVQKRKKNTRI